MNLIPTICTREDCADRFGHSDASFQTLNSFDHLVPLNFSDHSPDPDLNSGTSSHGDSLEVPDYYDACLSYINDVLMDEEGSDDTAATLADYGALQATEKSFYDALSESYPSSSDQYTSFVGLDSPSDDFPAAQDAVDLNSWVLNKGQIELYPCVVDTTDYPSRFNSRLIGSASSFEDDVGGTLADSPVSTGLTTCSFDRGSDGSTIQGCWRQDQEEKNDLVSERRARKNHQRDDDNCYQDARSNKQLASCNDEEYEEIEQYEYILLRKDEKDDVSVSKQQSLQYGVDGKSEHNGSGSRKGSRGRKSRSKKQSGVVGEVVDLRTLLNLCAQAVANFDIRGANDLLKQIREHSSPYGDSIQRVAHYFANGLEARMVGTGSQLYFSIINAKVSPSGVLKCYQRYTSAIPVNRISFFLANQMIARLAENATQVHIIDFGIYHGFQWPSLIQQLSERPTGPPKLRITGIDYPLDGFRPAEKVEQTGRRLKAYCDRFNVPFRYHAIAQNWETIQPEDIDIERGELVVVNSHYRSNTLLDETIEVNCPRDAFLRLIRKLQPDVFIHGIVNGSYSAPFFITRFREALFNFISVFDMFEATMPREDHERKMIEQDLHGKEILNIVASEGIERVARPETYKQWQVRTQRAGFRQLPLARDLLKRSNDIVKVNYHKDFVVDEDNHWMLQGWKGRILFAISCWKPA